MVKPLIEGSVLGYCHVKSSNMFPAFLLHNQLQWGSYL